MNMLGQLDADPLVVVISKSEVQSLNITPALETLSKLLSDRETALQYKGKVMLCFTGYDKDSRELYEVPEVKKYMGLLDSKFPFWFFFLSIERDALRLVAFCLCRTVNVRPGVASPNNMDMAQFMMNHFTALNYLCSQLGLPDGFIETLSMRIDNYFS